MVSEMVRQHHGAVRVDSVPGDGATFKVLLPRVSAAPAPAEAAEIPRRGTAPRASATILVVDDQIAIRELIEGVLRAEGHRVLLAASSADALGIAERHNGPIDLLLTDRAKPSAELASRLAEVRPDVKVLSLQKPFRCEALRDAVAEILNTVESTILVVDDDPSIRRFAGDVLRSCGYRVLEASGGKQALSLLGRHTVDVLITDLIMAEQDGLETIRAAKKNAPRLRVIAISGGFGEEFLEVARLLGAEEIIRKPFDAAKLRDTVARVTQLCGAGLQPAAGF
jgi:CheY-like chemotaxis protein